MASIPVITGTATVVQSASGSGSPSITVPADAELAILSAHFWHFEGGTTLSTCNISSSDMTSKVLMNNMNYEHILVYTLKNPPTGSQTLNWAFSDSAPTTGVTIRITYLKNCDTTIDPVRDADGAQDGTSGVETPAIDTDPDDLVLVFASADGSLNMEPSGGNQTEIYNATYNSCDAGVATKAGVSGTITGVAEYANTGGVAVLSIIGNPIYQVQIKVAQDGPGTQQQVTFDSAVTAGNLLICAVSAYNGGGGGGSMTFSDNHGDTWTEVQDVNYASNDLSGLAYCVNPTGGSTTITVSTGSSGSYFTIVAIEVACDGGTLEFDQSNSGTGSATTWTSGNVTTTEALEYMVGHMAEDTASRTLAEDASWDLIFEEEDQASNMPISVSERIVSATLTDAYTGAFTGGSTAHGSAVATFNAVISSAADPPIDNLIPKVAAPPIPIGIFDI